MRLLQWIEQFFWQPIDPRAAGVMRIAWGLNMLFVLVTLLTNFELLFGTDGIPGPARCSNLFCQFETLVFSSPGIHIFCLIMGISVLAVIIGLYPRIAIFISLLQLWWLFDRNGFIWNGGIRIQQAVGFLLLITPNIYCFSRHVNLRTRLQPIWIYRLVLLQIIALYGTASIAKASSGFWLNGSKIGYSLLVSQYSRFPFEWAQWLLPWFSIIAIAIVCTQMTWLLLLVPESIRAKFRLQQSPIELRQLLIISSIGIHAAIAHTMTVGVFFSTIIALLCGVLRKQDFVAIGRQYVKLRDFIDTRSGRYTKLFK